MIEVKVAGKTLELSPVTQKELRAIPIDTKLKFHFHRATFNGNMFCLLEAKKEENHSSVDCIKLAERLTSIFHLPIVFLFSYLQFIERNRLINRGVYFIVSDKYAFLPFLIINHKDSVHKKTDDLSAVAQNILLYHLEKKDINGCSMSDMEQILPYTYVTISRAFKNLEELQLCKVEIDENRVKHIFFEGSKKEVWERSLPFLKNPIRKRVFCDHIVTDLPLTEGGINALSHYTSLNPDEMKTYVMDVKEYKNLLSKKIFSDLNEIEGDICIEIWSYPPLHQDYADPLSLYLTLKDDKDPRVEKELETMIDKLWL
jgi:hypothetical protein